MERTLARETREEQKLQVFVELNLLLLSSFSSKSPVQISFKVHAAIRTDLNFSVCKSNFEKRNRKFDGVRDNRFCYLRFSLKVAGCYAGRLPYLCLQFTRVPRKSACRLSL